MANNNLFELSARYDSRKSFYGKAQVLADGNKLTLYSYNTRVCEIVDGIVTYNQLGVYSVTTNRHIREFIRQFAADDRKEV